jgi:hypothetical protein
MQIPAVLALVEILAADMELVKTICHYRKTKKARD